MNDITALEQFSSLLPCPFCGGPAEMDYNRQFYNYRGQPGRAVAIYCVNSDPMCHCDMTLCCEDVPNWNVDEMMAHLVEAWNLRI